MEYHKDKKPKNGCDNGNHALTLPLETWHIIVEFALESKLECKEWINRVKMLVCINTQFQATIYNWSANLFHLFTEYKQLEVPKQLGSSPKWSFPNFMKEIVKSDLYFIRLVKAIQSKINFLTIDCIKVKNEKNEKNDEIYSLIYNPFKFNGVEEMNLNLTFTLKPITGSDVFYKRYNTACNGMIRWTIKVIETDVNDLFNMLILPKWIATNAYKLDVDGFCKDVAHVYMNYPHAKYTTYVQYHVKFLQWMDSYEQQADIINEYSNRIIDMLKKHVLNPTERESARKMKEIRKMIIRKPMILSINAYSNKCKNLFEEQMTSFFCIREGIKKAIEDRQTRRNQTNKQTN